MTDDTYTLRDAMMGAALQGMLKRMPDGFEVRVVPHGLLVDAVVVTVKRLSLPDEQGDRRTVSHLRVAIPTEELGRAITEAVSRLEP